MSLMVEVLNDFTSLERLRPAWERLHRHAEGGPFSSIDWILAWADAFSGQAPSPRVVLVRDGDGLVAALVMGLQRGKVSTYGPRVHRLRMLCNDRAGFHEILSLPGREAEVAPLILQAVQQLGSWSLADLSPMLVTPALEQLVSTAEANGLACWQRTEVTRAVCDLSDGWEAYVDRHSRNFRKSLSSARRKFAEAGGTLRILHGGDPDAEAVLDRVMTLSSRCWKARSGTDIGTTPTDRKFFAALWARFSLRGAMRILLLSVGEHNAASAILFREGMREYCWISDFDETFAELSPGRNAVAMALESGAAEGVTTTDLMRRTAFSERFADSYPSYQRIRLCWPHSLPGLWLSLEEILRPLGRDLRRQFRNRTRKRGAFKSVTGNQPRDKEHEGG